MLHLMSGLMMPVEFNSSLMVFVPKGEEPDELSIVREPCNTRPLSLKSCDNKIICAVVNFALRTPLAAHSCPVQRGFIPGRQLVSNVVDLDVHGRIYGMQPVLLIATLRWSRYATWLRRFPACRTHGLQPVSLPLEFPQVPTTSS